MRESLVGAVLVQTDGLLLAVEPTDGTQPILRVPDQRPALQAVRAGATVGLAYPAFGSLQAMQLAAVQPGGNKIPEPGAGWV